MLQTFQSKLRHGILNTTGSYCDRFVCLVILQILSISEANR